MTLGQHQQAFSRDLVSLLSKAFELGYEVRMGEAFRPPEMQKIYVQTGRSKTMNSMHPKKTAIDLHFFKDGQGPVYPEELGKFWESLNNLNQWGGHWGFRDEPHFQRTVRGS